MHKSSLEKMNSFKKRYLERFGKKAIRILDIGSQNVSNDANGSYKQIFNNGLWIYKGADIVPANNVDIVLNDIYNWEEIASNSYDVVISGQAFEHIEYFWVTMLEITRVLKPGGLCCIIAPSGGYEHRYPVDCWRFYPDGFKSLCKFSGLKELEIYTEWEPQHHYNDGSELWKDSVLICEKPHFSFYKNCVFLIKNYLLKKIMFI